MIRDLHAYGGLMMMGVGIGFMSWPWALVTCGAVLAYVGFFRMSNIGR